MIDPGLFAQRVIEVIILAAGGKGGIMKIGMLWFDNSKDDLATKIQRAATYYQKKYGQYPDQCYVHPVMMNLLPDHITLVHGIEIHHSHQVLPNHFWLGNETYLPSNKN